MMFQLCAKLSNPIVNCSQWPAISHPNLHYVNSNINRPYAINLMLYSAETILSILLLSLTTTKEPSSSNPSTVAVNPSAPCDTCTGFDVKSYALSFHWSSRG